MKTSQDTGIIVVPYRDSETTVAPSDGIPRASDYNNYIERIVRHGGADPDYHSKRVDIIIKHVKKNIGLILVGSHTNRPLHTAKIDFPFHRSECCHGWGGVKSALTYSLDGAAKSIKTNGGWEQCGIFRDACAEPFIPVELFLPFFQKEKRYCFEINFKLCSDR